MWVWVAENQTQEFVHVRQCSTIELFAQPFLNLKYVWISLILHIDMYTYICNILIENNNKIYKRQLIEINTILVCRASQNHTDYWTHPNKFIKCSII